MTGPQDQHTARTLAELRVHQHYHGQGIQDLGSRLRGLEDGQRQASHTLAGVPEDRRRLNRLEEEVRRIKVVAGILVLALAASGQVDGLGVKMARALLGLP